MIRGVVSLLKGSALLFAAFNAALGAIEWIRRTEVRQKI
jgi:hypothetical protein